jgi:hypothetical protein
MLSCFSFDIGGVLDCKYATKMPAFLPQMH